MLSLEVLEITTVTDVSEGSDEHPTLTNLGMIEKTKTRRPENEMGMGQYL